MLLWSRGRLLNAVNDDGQRAARSTAAPPGVLASKEACCFPIPHPGHQPAGMAEGPGDSMAEITGGPRDGYVPRT